MRQYELVGFDYGVAEQKQIDVYHTVGVYAAGTFDGASHPAFYVLRGGEQFGWREFCFENRYCVEKHVFGYEPDGACYKERRAPDGRTDALAECFHGCFDVFFAVADVGAQTYIE